MQDKKDMFDIREGLRVAILHEKPSPLGSQKVWPPPKSDRRPATEEETRKVYATFGELLAIEGKGYAQEPAGKKGTLRGVPSGRSTKCTLSLVTWRSFFTWVETGSYGVGVREKCVFEAMLRASKSWHQHKATPVQQRMGVSLSMIFRWMWPFVSINGLRKMFTGLCLEAYENVRLPEPPVIGERERSEMVRLYNSMDMDKKGYCNAFDMAGGDHADYKVRLRNTIDEASVKRILGDRPILLEEFLELMCENGYRGTEGSTRAICADGRHVDLYSSEVVDFVCWIFHEAPQEQVEWMRKAEALEDEVHHWVAVATGKAKPRATMVGID